MENENQAAEVEAKEEFLTKANSQEDIKKLKAFAGASDRPHPAKLVSRLDHAVTVAYDGEALVIPPRAQGKKAVVIADWNKLGTYPAGVQLIKG